MALRDKLNSLAAGAASRANILASEAASKANTAIETGKLSLKINNEEKKIDEFTLNIGELILDKLDNGEVLDDEVMALYSSIQACREVIAGARAEIEAKRQADQAGEADFTTAAACTSCGEPLAQDANFCSNCGTKVEEEAPAPEAPAAEEASAETPEETPEA